LLNRSQVMDTGIRPLWAAMPRIAGPAFTVRCGVVVVPAPRAEDVLAAAGERQSRGAAQNLDSWEAAHRERIASILEQKGFEGCPA
jgi:regulator of RNase E activity RraA